MQAGRLGDERRAEPGPMLTSLWGNLLVFVGLPLVVNGVIFGLGWERGGGPQPGLPPGWVVGTIWVVLFAGMGVARWLLLRAAMTRGEERRAEWVSLLGLICLLYPFYTAGLRDDRVGLVGNLVTLAVAVGVCRFAWRRVRVAGVWLLAVCVWLAYAAAVGVLR
ncbi:MAG: TspO/MBR family protein [Acidobacteriaceae bacterium]